MALQMYLTPQTDFISNYNLTDSFKYGQSNDTVEFKVKKVSHETLTYSVGSPVFNKIWMSGFLVSKNGTVLNL